MQGKHTLGDLAGYFAEPFEEHGMTHDGKYSLIVIVVFYFFVKEYLSG